MTAVTIRPTFSKDTRPGNGLEEIADKLLADNHAVHYVVGVVKFAGGSVDDEGSITPAVKFLGIEPLGGPLADQAKQILDEARKGRGLGRMEDNLPPVESSLYDFGEDGRVTISKDAETRLAEEDGEGEPETRLGPDGEYEVPPPSAEEIVAELAEAKAKGEIPAAKFTSEPDA